MDYSIKQYHQLKPIERSHDKQLSRGFKIFIRTLMSNSSTKGNRVKELAIRRSYFSEKYQQLLNKGKPGNVQVIRVEKLNELITESTMAIHLTFQLLTSNGVKLFTSAAMATYGKVPVAKTIIPIFYNPDDFSVVVLL